MTDATKRNIILSLLLKNKALLFFLQTNSSKADGIYENKVLLEQEEVLDEDCLHYANVDFAKLQAKSEGDTGTEGQIRQASEMTEYSQIHLHSREGTEETAADANLG